ncbi:trypsin-like peptidase domain-containing protein [Micromonospora sp. NPDC048871]|uniref:trypsin-like peptidase domain-containing protein n=1 Tax=Micromonospora sp. NPDC048871 TaxID=3364259 RepID=UPI00371649D5
MTGLEPHVRRVVKVRGRLLGSGYAVGEDLVLTAGHVVGARGEPTWVSRSDSPDEPEHRATVIWRGDSLDADAALIRLDVPLWTAEETRTRYGELRGHQPVRCLTVGYPWVRVGPEGRLLDELPGQVMPSLGFEEHRYALDSTRIAPQPPQPLRDDTGAVIRDDNGAPVLTEPNPHSGYSGAPLLTAGDRQLLLGVMVAVPSRYGPGRLDAVRLTRLLADPPFAGLVGTSLDQVEREPPQLLPTGIIEHAEALTELADNLRGDRLPYVSPADSDTATHPGRLLSRLDEQAGQSGLLLVGQAGIGKTRTCLEVAGRAVEAGWRVLHVRPGEPLVTTEQLIEVVTGSTDERLLIIIDYLNLSALDYPAIRHRLLPAARARGIRLALLGSARPGWFHQKDNTSLTEVFKPVELRPDEEHLDRIRHQVVTSLAPRARTILGDERLLQLCGRRPVIATLIAAAAEAQADRGRLSADTGDLRPENLLDWLVRRLNEDDLLHHAERLDDDRDPDLRLQVYAAMAAATPQVRPALVACGARVEHSDESRAEHLLDVLLAMGWLIHTPDGLAPVHDIVVDQLLEHTTVRAGLNTVRAKVADRILDASLTSARTIGRYAMNLDRLLRDMALQHRDGPLAAHCTAWLTAKATAAGTLLASEQNVGAYALGSVLDNSAWAQVVFRHWPQLGEPWLTAHGASLPARHILYKGLRTVATSQAAHLIGVATAWLAQHRTALEASFVTATLLNRDDLPPEDARQGIDAALRWLDQHGHLTEAQFVLHPLLHRDDLTPQDTPRAIQHALHWLDQHGHLTEAQFVLHPLLGRDDQPEEVVTRAVDVALTWLQEHSDTVDAGFVLPRLLAIRRLADLPQWLPPLVDRWAHRHRSAPAVVFVSKYLARQNALTQITADVLLQWAADHPQDIDIPWRLTGVAAGLDRYPSLADRLLRSVEGYLDAVEHETVEVNGHGELDGLIQALCRRRVLRCGLAGARLDDIMLRWLAHPAALNQKCPKTIQFSDAVSRVLSLIWAGRYAHQEAVEVLTRLHRWIPAWLPSEPHLELRDAALRDTAALLAALAVPPAVQQLAE